MAANCTVPTAVDPAAFLQTVEPARRRQDARALDALFREVTGYRPVILGPSIVGYGRYDYRYESGREGRFLAAGFAPRKANFVVYIMPGYANLGPLLDRLGPHRRGRSCLYLNRLSDVDTAELAQHIRVGLTDLSTRWPVHPE